MVSRSQRPAEPIDQEGGEEPTTTQPNTNPTLSDIFALLTKLQLEIRSLDSKVEDVRNGQDTLEVAIERLEEATGTIPKKTAPVPGPSSFAIPKFSKPDKGKGRASEPAEPTEREASAAPAAKSSKVKFICPKPYDGKEKGKEARKWLNKMMVYISGNINGFVNETQAISWFLTNMDGIAGDWADLKQRKILLVPRPEDVASMDGITAAFRRDFDDPDSSNAPARKIESLSQGSKPVQEYTLEFQNLQGDLDWNDSAYMQHYKRGLTWRIKNIIAAQEKLPTTLQEWITRAQTLGNQLVESDLERPKKEVKEIKETKARVTTTTSTTTAKSMPIPPEQFVTKEERKDRIAQGLCAKCGEKGHIVRNCPND